MSSDLSARPAGPATAVAPDVPVLALRDVCKTFTGVRALKGVDLDIAPGEIHALVGANGSGKSTLIKTLAGYHLPDPGSHAELNGEPFAFEVMYGSGAITNDQTVAYLQDAWSQIGVQMTPNPVDFDTVLVPAITENFNYEACLLAFNWDPTGDQSAMFHSNAQDGQGFNFMSYSNPEVDALLDKANRTIDPAARVETLIEANNLINDDLPIVVISFRYDRTAYNVRMHNFHPNAPGGLLWSLPYVWVEQ